MIQCQLKLKLTPRQERELNRWLRHLTPIWNWGIKRIERDAEIGIYHRRLDFRGLLKGHAQKLCMPQDAVAGILAGAYQSWRRCFGKISRKPRLKGRRNRLNYIPFNHSTKIVNNRLLVPRLGRIRFNRQLIPEGHIGQFRLVRRASGWHVCLFIQAESDVIPVSAICQIGIDPGFHHLLTLSDGTKIPHPRELQVSESRMAQAQRGKNRRFVARIQERIRNQRKDRNHKLSRYLVAENEFIAFSADPHAAIVKRFGKSVASSGHAQLRQMLSYKIERRADGLGVYVEVNSRNSTKTCSACGCLSGPSGLAGLKVRQWTCVQCGAEHDRDVNAAINTLIAGAETVHERLVKAA